MFSNYNIRSLEDHSENGKATVNVENPREIKLISSNSSGEIFNTQTPILQIWTAALVKQVEKQQQRPYSSSLVVNKLDLQVCYQLTRKNMNLFLTILPSSEIPK